MRKRTYTTEGGFDKIPYWVRQCLAFTLLSGCIFLIFTPLLLLVSGHITVLMMCLIYGIGLISFFAYLIYTAKPISEPDPYLQRHRQSICEHTIDGLITDADDCTWCKQCGVQIDLKTKQAVIKPYKTTL
jgi:hypothetical protein